MALDPKELGQRLQMIREAKQITQAAAAKVLGVSRAYIAQIESGSRPINTLQLEKLANLYGRDVGEFFATAASQAREATAVFFRITDELKQKINRKTLEPSIRLLREYTNLEKLLGLDTKFKRPNKYEVPEPTNTWEAIQVGQQIAEEERQRLQLGTRPIKDMAELLEIQGVRVLGVAMDADISGVFMGDDQIGLSILLNTEHHKFRHAFTLAHEYCHVLSDRARATVVSSAKTGKDLIEVRANSFAAAFLLPKTGVEEFFQSLGKIGATRSYLASTGAAEPSSGEQRRPASAAQIQLYDVVHLQHHYGVSWDAAVYRLQNLGLISKDESEDLLGKRDEAQALSRAIKLEMKPSSEEKKFENRDFAARFFSLGVDAYRQEIISLKKLEELMDLIGIEADQLKHILRNAGISEKAAAGR